MKVWTWFRARPNWLQVLLWVFFTLPVLAVYAWPKGGKGKFFSIALAGVWLLFASAIALGGGGSTPNAAGPGTAARTTATAPATTEEAPAPTPTGPTPAEIQAKVEDTFGKRYRKATVSIFCDGSAEDRFTCSATVSGTLNLPRVAGDYSARASGKGGSAFAVTAALNRVLPGKVTKAQAWIRHQSAVAVAKHQRQLARQRALAKIGTPVAREQAIESARSYLDMGGFSRSGLIKQLSSPYGESFGLVLATWAVDQTHANWNEQAVESARSYLQIGGFSRDSLIEQLTSSYGEGFTYAQALYAVNKVGL